MVIVILSGVMLAGCSSDAPTQLDCMKDGQFSYDGQCTDYADIPESDQQDVWNQVADEISQRDGISKKEALQEILDNINEYQQNNN